MEAPHNLIEVLRASDRPAFLVSGGVIRQANQAAENRMIPVGEPIGPLLLTGQEEYAAFTEGWLGLSIRVGEAEYQVSVHPFGEDHIFTVEPGEDDARLQALSLAAVELRKPLSNIRVVTDQLFPRLDESNDRQLAQINRGLAQLERLVNNMAGAVSCYRNSLNLEVRDVDSVLRELFERAAALCQEAGVSLTYRGLDTVVYSRIDEDRLERCLYNVISNALKHTPKGGQIQADLSRRGNSLQLTILDPGTGLGESLSRDLYGLYRREPAIGDERGLGLGMRMVHACVTLHGGTVLLCPRKDGGTRLTINLPIRLGGTELRSYRNRVDYAGEQDHGRIELSESLPWELYKPRRD